MSSVQPKVWVERPVPPGLSHSLGHPGDPAHPEVAAAIDRVADAVVDSDKALGIYAGSPATAKQWLDIEARYPATGVDGFIEQGLPVSTT